MAILIKKNKDSIIRKVRIKMACSCNCHATCTCSCTSTSGFVAPHGDTDAQMSSDAHDFKSEKIQNSLIN
jgi:hypothetical protein